MTNNTFYMDYNVTGAERKRLVQAISAYTQADAKYLGVPTFAYKHHTKLDSIKANVNLQAWTGKLSHDR